MKSFTAILRKNSFIVLTVCLVFFIISGCGSTTITPVDNSDAIPQTTDKATSNDDNNKEQNTSSEKDSSKTETTKVETTTQAAKPSTTTPKGKLTVHYIDVGQGASQLIQTPSGKTMLIDGGNNDDEQLMVNYLKKQGIKKVDVLIGTHPDADHIGGLDAVVDAFDIGKIYGQIDTTYQNKKGKIKYIIDRQSNIIDHSNSSITNVKFNSSKRNIKKNESDYLKEITKLIKEKHKPNKRVLIVCQKDIAGEGLIKELNTQGYMDISLGDTYNDEILCVNWFGNLIGKNTWKDFEQIWIIGTPNLPMELYFIKLCQTTGNEFSRTNLQMVSNGKNKYSFKNKDMKNVADSHIVSTFYQSIKRIQRNSNPAADIYIVSNDDHVFNETVKQLKNIKVNDSIQLDLKSKTEATEVLVKSDQTNTIIEHLLSKSPGTYSKAEICEELEIDKSNFSKYFNKSKLEYIMIGADLRDADIRGTDLSNSIFLTQSQINSAKGDDSTSIPSTLQRPAHWNQIN